MSQAGIRIKLYSLLDSVFYVLMDVNVNRCAYNDFSAVT